jgi:membrane protease YdiL (CAAX protease family)
MKHHAFARWKYSSEIEIFVTSNVKTNKNETMNSNSESSIFRIDFLEIAIGILLICCWVCSYVLGYLVAPAAFYLALLMISYFVPRASQMKETAIALGVAFVMMRIIHFIPVLGDWPAAMFVIAGGCFAVLRKTTNVDFSCSWSFRFSKFEIASIAVIVVPSLLILLWYYRTFPEVAKSWPLPEMPGWAVPLAICGAALINGLGEELVYRFILQRAFIKSNSPAWAILMQAIAFGFLHYRNGFPQGWTGMLLTTLFGAAIGIQFFITRSITLAWVTHAIMDAIMFGIIVSTATPTH